MHRPDIAGSRSKVFAINRGAVFEQLDFVAGRFHDRDQDLDAGHAGNFGGEFARLMRSMRKFETEDITPESQGTFKIRDGDTGVVRG